MYIDIDHSVSFRSACVIVPFLDSIVSFATNAYHRSIDQGHNGIYLPTITPKLLISGCCFSRTASQVSLRIVNIVPKFKGSRFEGCHISARSLLPFERCSAAPVSLTKLHPLDFRLKSMAEGGTKNSHNSPLLKLRSVINHLLVVLQRSVTSLRVCIAFMAIKCSDVRPKRQFSTRTGLEPAIFANHSIHRKATPCH